MGDKRQNASWIADEYGGSYLNNPDQQNRDYASARSMARLIQRTVQDKGGDYYRTGALIDDTLRELSDRAPFGFVTPAFALGMTQVLMDKANKMDGPQFVKYLEGIKDRDNPLFFWQKATLDPLFDEVKDRTRQHVEKIYGKSDFSVFSGLKGHKGEAAYWGGATDAVLNELGGGARGLILAISNPTEAARRVIDDGRHLDRLPQAIRQQLGEAKELIKASQLDDYHKGYLGARVVLFALDVKDAVETGMSLANFSKQIKNGNIRNIDDAMRALEEGPQVLRRADADIGAKTPKPGSITQTREVTMKDVTDSAVAKLPEERQPAYRQALGEALQSRGINDADRARKFVADLNAAPDGATMQSIHRRASEIIAGPAPVKSVAEIATTAAKSMPDNVEWAYDRALRRTFNEQGINTPEKASAYLAALSKNPNGPEMTALNTRAYSEVLDRAVENMPLNVQDYYRQAIHGMAAEKGQNTISGVHKFSSDLLAAPAGQSMRALHHRANELFMSDVVGQLPENVRPAYRQALGQILKEKGADTLSEARTYVDRLNGAPNGPSAQALHTRAYQITVDSALERSGVSKEARPAYYRALGEVFEKQNITSIDAAKTYLDRLNGAPKGQSMQALHDRAFAIVTDDALNSLPEAKRNTYRQALREQFSANGVDTASEARRYVLDLSNSPQALERLHQRAAELSGNPNPKPSPGAPSAKEVPPDAKAPKDSVPPVDAKPPTAQTPGNDSKPPAKRELILDSSAFLDGQSVPYTPRFNSQHNLTGSGKDGTYTTISGHGAIIADETSQQRSFVVPKGVNVYFMGLPGATITDRLGQRADVGGDLSGVPLLKTGSGDTIPDLLILPSGGTINIMGKPITVDDPKGVRLSELIDKHGLTGNIVVAACLKQSTEVTTDAKWSGITFDLPEHYPPPKKGKAPSYDDSNHDPETLPVYAKFHNKHGLTGKDDGGYTAIGGNASLSGVDLKGKQFTEKFFEVPEGVTLFFTSPPGGRVTNKLAEAVEKGQDLSNIPLYRVEAGNRVQDPMLFKGTYEVAGQFIAVTDPNGKRLSEVIREHGIKGNVVVAPGLAGPGHELSNTLFKRPDEYSPPVAADRTHEKSTPPGTRDLGVSLQEVVGTPKQEKRQQPSSPDDTQTPANDRQSTRASTPPQPGAPEYQAYVQSKVAIERLEPALAVPKSSESTEKLVVAAATVAVQQNLRVDEVAFNKATPNQAANTTAFVIEHGRGRETDRYGSLVVQTAMSTPLEEGYRRLNEVAAPKQETTASKTVSAQTNEQEQPTKPPSSPRLS